MIFHIGEIMEQKCSICKKDLQYEETVEMKDGSRLCIDCYDSLDFKRKLQEAKDVDKVIREMVQEVLSKKYFKVD